MRDPCRYPEVREMLDSLGYHSSKYRDGKHFFYLNCRGNRIELHERNTKRELLKAILKQHEIHVRRWKKRG